MSAPIDQTQIDCVASFVEACAELEREPFFGKDEKINFSMSGNRWVFTLGDRFHFRSALISFRRIWMPTEPSSLRRVVEIIHTPGLPFGISAFAQHHESRIDGIMSRTQHLGGMKLPSERIINLWLNTVFAHGGIEGKNRRSDFEAIVDQYGHARFEYCFRAIVRELGGEYLNIANLAAKPLLETCRDTYALKPSFQIGSAFGIKRREMTKEGHLIIREGSSEYFTEETIEERFLRILNRFEHQDLKFIFEHIGRTPNEWLRAILGSSKFLEILTFLEARLVADIKDGSLNETDAHGTCCIGQAGVGHTQERIYIYEGAIVTNDIGLKILDQAVAVFRKEFLKK